ncbi:hypothetical protein [Bacteroides sp.]|uniref:hypothetical protein n=1 Tax=Bacteroides sp. TaxID=29523 RepID=UPI00260400E8|nr:hypothetical protein [Bacteroides sp.]MDD3037381.1 hypothetical protein [Bacteroides sp.]
MRKILLTALVASSLFACSEQEATDTQPLAGENTVTLSLKQEALNRGVSDQKGDTEYAVIGSGKIFFINASGNNIYQRELTATEITALANTSTTPGNKTVTITGVPNTATTLFFIANIKTSAGASFPMVSGTTSADARLRIDQLQANATNVPMSGQSGTFTQVSTNVYNAAVTLTPMVARVEVGQTTCQNQNGVGQPAVSADITGYKLSGVFVNNTRQDVLLSGTPYLVGSPIDIRSQAGWSTSWATYFTSANTSFPYYVGGSPAGPSDWVANALSTYCTPLGANALSFYPDPTNGSTSTDPAVTPKKAWGYQICPSTTVPAGSAADVPHIILKLTDVTYVDNPLGLTTQYVTVTKYKDDLGNPVPEFKKGNVYRIKNLTFTHNEATNQPYETNISVTATVSVAPWVINNVNPDWN